MKYIFSSISYGTSDTSHYENVPFEVPVGWSKCCLYDIVSADCTLGYGIVQPMDDIEDGVPVVRPVDLTAQIICDNGLKRIDPTISDAYQRTILKGGEILFCVRASVGKLGIASPELKGANVTRGISPIRFDYECLTKYVYFHLQSFFSQNEIKYYSRGATLQQINVEDLKKLSIALPPLNEQKRIVNELEQWLQVCDIIEDSESRLIESLSTIKSKILDLAIHGKLVPQDDHDEPASELLKRINPKAVSSCDNPHYADIPESWVECKLGDVCSFESGYAYSSELYKPMGIPLIRISNIVDGYVNIENCVYIKGDELSKNVQVKQGDLLIAMSGATTGKLGIYAYPDDAILNQRVGNIRVKECSVLSTGYRDLFINAIKVEIEKKAYGGAQPNISGKMICNFSFSLPPYNEQLRIVSKVNEFFSQLDMIEKSLQA